jgi:hypothetical protein
MRRANSRSLNLVGDTGFEPATSRPPAVRASQLRQSPLTNLYFNLYLLEWVPLSYFAHACILVTEVRISLEHDL